MNAYDRCVAHKLVNGKQCTLLWYVDYNKVSHIESKYVEDLIKDLKNNFRELVVTRGKKHIFLGVNINITEDKKVEIEMKEKLLKAIEALKENIDEKLTTPASSHLFIFNEQAQQLYEENSEIFHLAVAKLLCMMRRARPDLETAISFLCRRVSKRDVETWKN